jgi:hypothetical protein
MMPEAGLALVVDFPGAYVGVRIEASGRKLRTSLVKQRPSALA